MFLEAVTAPLSVPLPAGWKADRLRRASLPSASESCKTLAWFDYVPAASVEYTKRLVDTESLDVRTLPPWAERQYTDVLLGGRRAVQLRRVPVEPDLSPYHVTASSTYLAEAAGGVLLVHLVSRSDHPLACLVLHDGPAAELAAAFFAPAVLERAARLSKKSEPPRLREPEPIPRSLEESFALLEKGLGNEDLATLRSSSDGDLARYHFGIGLWMRKHWGLSDGSPLATYFERMGVYAPDDMSAMILRSFWQYLNGLPITVVEDAAASRRYSELSRTPDPKACNDGSPAVHLFGLTGRGLDRYVHVYACDADGTYWAHELGRGWYPPDSALLDRIIELREARGIVEAPIEPPRMRAREASGRSTRAVRAPGSST